MVAPAWGQFQRPNEAQEEQGLENEYKQEVPGEIGDQQQAEGEKPQWGQFKTPTTYQEPEEDESTLDWIARNIVQSGSTILSTGLGALGNAEKFGKDVLANFPQSAGLVGWAISELVGPEKWEKLVRGPMDRTMTPTTSQLKEGIDIASQGYTKPKTPGEEKFQEVLGDVASTFIGRRLPNQMNRQTVFNHMLTPVAANAVKQTVNDLGFGDSKANTAKAATWLSMSLMGNVNAPQHASELMNRGRQGIPSNVQIDVPRMQQRLQTLRNDPHLLHSDPRTALARQQIDAIERDLANGQTSVNSSMTAYDGINAAKRNRDLFSLSRSDQAFAKRAIDRVRNVVRDEIIDSSQAYPEALQSWRNGVQAWATIHQSRAITNLVENLAKGPYAKILGGPALGLFGVGSLGAAKAPIVGLPLAGGAPLAYKAYQVGHRVWNNPTLSNYYWRAISEAQRDNIPAFLQNYEKLNSELKKKEKKSNSSKRVSQSKPQK